jgi:hypothetical protein
VDLVGSAHPEVAHLDQRLDPGLSGRALGDQEHSDRLDRSVLALGRSRGPTRQSCSSSLDGVERIGLALVATGLAVGPVDLDDVDVIAPQEPGETSAVGTGALDANRCDLAEGFEPGEEGLVAIGIDRERLGADQSTQRIEGCGDVDIGVGVDASSDAGLGFYDGHGHPFLSFSGLGDGTAVPDQGDGGSACG